jgi:hypothetical protein
MRRESGNPPSPSEKRVAQRASVSLGCVRWLVRTGVKDPCMAHEGPRLVEWTDHAFVKAGMLGSHPG